MGACVDGPCSATPRSSEKIDRIIEQLDLMLDEPEMEAAAEPVASDPPTTGSAAIMPIRRTFSNMIIFEKRDLVPLVAANPSTRR